MKGLKNNLLLKITSLNSLATGIRLVISIALQKILSELLGASGYAKVGTMRNLIPMLESFATVGIFNGVVKYVSEHKEDEKELGKLFSTSLVYISIATLIAALSLYIFADQLSLHFFKDEDYYFVFQLLSVIVPFIAMNRFFNGVINGLSAYKKYTAINLLGYLLSSGLLLFCVYQSNLHGALFAIAITPIIQFSILMFLFFKTLKSYFKFKNISFSIPYKNELLAFTLMSFAATLLSNFVEIDIRNTIEDKIGDEEAGYWTAITFIARNYLLFASSLFTLYVIPKFARIHTNTAFRKELMNIYATLLPLFGLGMLLVYFLRGYIVDFVYPTFQPMTSLFKWQLCGDFIKLMAMILAHQFFAKRMVMFFVSTEIISLALFYGLTVYFIPKYGTEGVVFAHFVRYLIYFVLVVFLLRKHIFGRERAI